MSKHFEASVIEDNGGGLALYVFGEGGINGSKVIWAHTGYEYIPGNLSLDLKAILSGDDPRTDWDGGVENPQEIYDGYDRFEYGWEVVAQVHNGEIHKFAKRMGRAAQIEFGVGEE